MEILVFHCQQILSRVNGMQNTHHWATCRHAAVNTHRGRQDQIIHAQLSHYRNKMYFSWLKLAKSKLIVQHQREKGKKPYSVFD